MSSEPAPGSGGHIGNCLVRVRAQVMVRDDYTGGWVPMGGGGLSQVSVRKKLTLVHSDESAHCGGSGYANYTTDYQIYGKRLTDQYVVLSCAISKDFTYNKVMPTFHHWKCGDKRFGLTFQTSSDARAFDKAIHSAIDDLYDLTDTGLGSSSTETLSGEDDVFMALELPLDSRSSTASSNGTSSSSSARGLGSGAGSMSSTAALLKHRQPVHTASAPLPGTGNHLHRISYLNTARPVPTPPVPAISSVSVVGAIGGVPFNSPTATVEKDVKHDNNTSSYQSNYGHITAQHDYSYIDSNTVQSIQPSSGCGATAKQAPLLPSRSPTNLPLPIKKKGGKPGREGPNRLLQHCRHCLQDFAPEENRRGVCAYGPDPVRTVIEKVSCVRCAECVLYHWRDGDDSGASRRPSIKRWAAVAVLSIFVPCMWLYIPMKACHRCGISCSLCGARHEP